MPHKLLPIHEALCAHHSAFTAQGFTSWGMDSFNPNVLVSALTLKITV